MKAYFLICAVYVLSGKAALMLALPPGYASAVFPPAGIAVAAAYIMGRRVLPWVLLGSLILNVWVGYSTTKSFGATGASAALIIAIASTLQAAFGGWILRRRIGYPAAFDKGVEIFRFLTWSPVICLLSASLSVGSLIRLGVIDKSESVASWISWWTGDTLGVLVMLPVVMALAGEPRALWKSRIKTVALPMMVVLSIIVALFLRVNQWEQYEALTDYRHITQQSLDQIKMGFVEQEALLAQLQGFFEHDREGKVERDEFHRYCRSSLQVFPMIQAMEWVPRVASSDRESFEKVESKDRPGFQITERNHAGKLQRAEERDWYYPVTYIEPLAGNMQALGFDLASNPERRHAIDETVRSGKIVSTEPIQLVQGGKGLLIIQSVKIRGKVEGVVLIVLKVQDFVNKLLPTSSRSLAVRLVDADTQDVLYDGFSDGFSGAFLVHTFEFATRRYSLMTMPTPEYYKQHRGWQSWGVLAIGTFGTGLLGSLFLLGTGYTARVEGQVRERTKALQESEERFRHTFEHSPIGIGVASLEGQFLRGNQAFCNIFGCTGEELLRNMNVEDIALPGRSANDADNMQRLVAGGRSHYRMEKRHFRKDGKIIWIQVTVSLERDISGIPEEFIVQIEDITERKRIEDALKASSSEIEDLYDHAPCGYHSVDENGMIVRVNQTELDWFGRKREEMIGKRISDFFTPASQEVMRKSFERFKKEGSVQGLEFEIVRKDGTIFPVLLNGTAIYDESGKFIMSRSVLIDITTQKKMDQMIHDKMLELQSILDGASVAITFVRSRRQVWANKRMGELFGYSSDEMDNQSTRMFYSSQKEYDAFGVRAYPALMRGETYQAEAEMRHHDGHAIWINISGKAISPDDMSLGSIWVLEDITDRKHYEEAIRESAEHMQTIFDNVVDGIITIDEEGIIATFNRAAEHIFGYSEGEVVGKNVSLLMPRPDRDRHDGYIRNYVITKIPNLLGTRRELTGLRSDGSEFPMDVALSEISRKGRRMFVGIVRDISERKRMEKMKNEFVSTVSHELRTPLTSITGALGLMAGGALGSLPEQIGGLVDIAYKNSQQLGYLINDLLDMEKMAAGKLDFDMQVQAVMPLVEQALEVNRGYGDQYNVRYVLKQRVDDARVRVDGKRFVQILSNFMSNAAKFSPAEGEVEIAVKPKEGLVRVEVLDHGGGIPEEFKDRIFQKFSQADSSDTRKKGGTGLGLAISRELAERMECSVGFESETGKGAIFFIDLPLYHEVQLN